VKTVLIAGASGLVGRAALRHFAALSGWSAIGVSCRVSNNDGGATLLSLDLCDASACRTMIERVGSKVTHLIFAAQYEAPGLAPGWFDPHAIERNDRMLRNFFEPLVATISSLEHVSLMQGSKAYGMHHPEISKILKAPLRESDPRIEHPNFYFVQEDYLRERQQSGAWGLTVFRPTVIYGDASGVNMSALRAIAVYAALERERGTALDYPGASYEQPFREAVDCDLVAEAPGWAATAPQARNATFNLTNGDTFTWRHTWQVVAEAFGMQPGLHRPMSFQRDLPKRYREWAALIKRYSLAVPESIEEHVGANSLLYADWMLGDGLMAPLNSIIAIRQAGFHGCMHTEDMFRKWFTRVQLSGVVSPLGGRAAP